MLYAKNKGGSWSVIPAVQVGDHLLNELGTETRVHDIKTVERRGLYAPYTASGDIVL